MINGISILVVTRGRVKLLTRPSDGLGGGVDTSSFGFNNDFGDNY